MKNKTLHIISIILLLWMGEIVVAANVGTHPGVSYASPLKEGCYLSELRTHQGASLRDSVTVSDVRMTRNGQCFTVSMTMHLQGVEVDANRAVLLTPCLKNGTDSVELPSVGIYGRRRYYFYVRQGESMLSGKEELSYRAAERPDSILYNRAMGYAEWMDGADLTLHRSDYGCCNSLLAEQDELLGHHVETVFPALVYVSPQAEMVKKRTIEGSAFIDFPVNRTEIHPDYRNNAAELLKIEATIDSVRSDRDVTITQVWLKGYASPESPYRHNKELAIGRTEALKQHIRQLYEFREGIIATDHEPEDWAGLRRYVEQSDLEHRTEILALIDSDTEPDRKELKIKSTYPVEYCFLLQNCYPALRHTDYRIAYDIRSYNDAAEIARVLKEAPQKLSLNELYIVAQELEPGTEQFTEVFETAVRMYPADETANLNAANAAMSRGDTAGAERYLARAGRLPEAIYARAALAIYREDYAAARRYLLEAKSLGLEQAAITLDELNRRTAPPQ